MAVATVPASAGSSGGGTGAVAAAAEPAASLPPTLADLAWQARYAGDDEARQQAVTALAQYREASAVEALLAAASDPVAAIRFTAVQALAYYLADGLDPDGRMIVVLQQARLDPDPQVAALAERWARSAGE